MRRLHSPPPSGVSVAPLQSLPGELERTRNDQRGLVAAPILQGRYLVDDTGAVDTTEILFAAGGTRQFTTGLGKRWTGFQATPLTAVEARLYTVASDDETKLVRFYAVTDCTCRIWIW
jgi:hypothetical protein